MNQIAKLKVIDLCFKRNDKISLLKISFQLESHKIFSLLGPSGSGKSTLLRCLLGLERPESGQIFLDNKIISDDQNFIETRFRRMSYVPQDLALFPHLSVIDNIGFGLADKKKQRTDELIHELALHGLENSLPHQISGGQQQRVAIARALAPRPKLLVLDEPMSQLDPDLRTALSKLLRKAASTEDCAIILTSHHLEDVYDISDFLMILKDGAVQKTGSPQSLFQKPQIIF